ncbi:hypothetical protein CA13_37960 [Planctomycetes bacterium CA13]|uniref:Uncharacterized protein n=1 Tax=Novipirellula herctigrandis TaxID=2527986 RepID=A0A5C5Z507_9BACT|nr:hypothetical protein CA13_37960 [Planctomycetes bacterium CA13]
MGKIEVLQNCLGRHYLTIHTALEVLARRTLKLVDYEILIVVDNGVETVIFKDTRDQSDALVNFGVQPELKFVLAAEHLLETLKELKQLEIAVSIKGKHYQIIDVSVKAFREKLEVDLVNYKIQLVRDGESVVAIFTDKDRDPMTRGHNPKCPSFEVELNPDDLRVRRANFIR